MHIENAHEHTGSAEAIRPSLRNGFTAYFALSPVTGLSCHRCSQEACFSRTQCQRRGIRTTRLRRPLQPRSSVAATASIASRPAFRDDCAYAPLVGRDDATSEGDLPLRSRLIAATDWHDGQISLMAVKTYLMTRRVFPRNNPAVIPAVIPGMTVGLLRPLLPSLREGTFSKGSPRTT